MSRFVVKPLGRSEDIAADVEPLADTGLFVTDVPSPQPLLERDEVAWAAPVEGSDSYPTGEVSIRFAPTFDLEGIESFVRKHSLEVLTHNEFVPQQVVVAPSNPHGTWLPDVVEHLNDEPVVARAWPNMLSLYRRA